MAKISSVNLSVSTSSNTAGTDSEYATVNWSASVTMGNYCLYGVGLKIYVDGELVKTKTGYASSTGQTICSCSGSTKVKRKKAARDITVQAKQYSTTVSGYGGVGESHSTSKTANIKARVYAAPGSPTIEVPTSVLQTQAAVVNVARAASQGNAAYSGMTVACGSWSQNVTDPTATVTIPASAYPASGNATITVTERHTWFDEEKTSSASATLTIQRGEQTAPSIDGLVFERGTLNGSTWTRSTSGNHLRVVANLSHSASNQSQAGTLALKKGNTAVTSASFAPGAGRTLTVTSLPSGITGIEGDWTLSYTVGSYTATASFTVRPMLVAIDVEPSGKVSFPAGVSIANGLQTAAVSNTIGEVAGGAYGTSTFGIPAHAGTLLGVMQLYFNNASGHTTAIANCGASIEGGNLSVSYRNVSSTKINAAIVHAVLLYAL